MMNGNDIDIKNVQSMVEVKDAAPTFFANSIFSQLKIVNIPAQSTGGQAAATFNVDEVLVDADATWPHNITDTAITSTSTVSMPPPLVSGTTYYIIRISDGICKLAATPGGAAIHITASETGIWTITSTAVKQLYAYNNKASTWNSASLT